jgi:hypothetical protein
VALAAVMLLFLLVAPLATPYWWDAGAVYVPGAKWVSEHGFDVRPGVFPSDFSRGHTPLFFLIVAFVYRVAGAGPVGGHLLALGFGWMAIVYTFALGRFLGGSLSGVVAAALLLTEPLFLTMSSDVLPEVAVTALTAATFYAFARGKMVECAVWGTLLVLVKETGVACPLAIAAVIAGGAVRSQAYREGARRVAITLVPVFVLAAFFLYQKWAEGWFILPYHADLFHATHSLVLQLVHVGESIFVADGRIVALVASTVFLAARRGSAFDKGKGPLLCALALHALANLAFFTKMSFLERYTLSVHMDAAVVIAALLAASGASLRAKGVGLAAAALTIVIALVWREAGNDMVSGETSFRYLHAVHAYKALYAKIQGTPVVLTQWPVTDALRDPYLGWVARPLHAIDIGSYHPGTDVVESVVAVPTLGSYERLVREARALGFHLQERVAEESASIELWGP